MPSSKFAFLPGAALPLSRPRARQLNHSRRCPFASATSENSDNAAIAAKDAIAREVGSGPAVAIGSLAPPLRAILAAATVAASGAVGFAAAPAKAPSFVKPIAAVTGVAVAGAAFTQLRGGAEKAARKYLASILAESGISDPQLPNLVAKIPAKFGIGEDDFISMKQSIYQFYFLSILTNPNVSFSEIAKLQRLKAALSMSGAFIGNAHYESSRAFYRNNVIYLDSEDDESAKEIAQSKLDKLLFLSDRMFADKDTEEAYAYEKSRIIKFFSMSSDEYNDRVAKVALPFYQEVITRACKDPAISEEDINAAQATLGVTDIQAERIRADSYGNLVDSLVSQKGKLDETDNETLSRLRTLLKIADERATSTLNTLAEPVYKEEVGLALDAVAKGEESLASIYGRLALRQSELSYPTDAARKSMSQVMTDRAVDIIRLASKYLRVQNVNGCLNQLHELLKYAEGVVGLMRVSNDDLKDETAIIRFFLPNVSDVLSKIEPRQMYRIFLSKCLEKRQITEDEEKQITRLRAVLGLSTETALDAFKSAAGPVYKKTVTDAVAAGTFSDEEKTKIATVKKDLALPEPTSKGIDLDIYRNRLERLVDGNRIIQEHEAQDLFVLRQFLDLSQEDTVPVHKSLMGPVYEQSVTEAMGPTGIMLEEYKSGLERLRDRLGLSKEDAEAAFLRVVKQRMLMYVNRAMVQLEKRQTFRGQNEERDVGDDPNVKRAGAFLGIDAGGLPIELSNLVDFYTRNDLIKEEETEIDGEKKTIQKYSVSLRGELQPKVYNELYKQYVIQCFSASTRAEKQRLFSVLDQLGSILGMSEDEIGKIHSEIGTVIYKNYVNQALLKGPLEEKDSEFLNNIQRMLSMKEDHCTNLLKKGKENRVSVLLEQIFAQPKVLPETVKKMRTVANSLKVDMVKDLSVPEEQRKKLFGVEIDAAIDIGALSANNQDLVKELQGDLQVSDNAAKEILLSCIQRRTLSHLVQATASLRQGRSESAVAEVKTMLRYGKLLPTKINAPAVSTTEKQELYLLFQADVITDGAVNDLARDQINLLKTMFGFEDADLEVLA